MKKFTFLLILALLISFVSVNKAFSYWIWTPKTGRWINPKYAPKPTPKEQLDYALSVYKENKFKEAEREFKSLLKHYPKSAEAAEAQYYLGLTYETQEKYYEAYQAYQKVIDKYPFSERIQEILEREFKIAEKFMSGEKRKFAGVPIPVENPAIEILTKIVDNSQYGPLAAVAQYKLGLVFMGLNRFYEAEEAFQKVVTNYPTSEWAEAAKYQIAASLSAQSKGPEYDQVTMKEAKDKFEEFVKEHPEAILSKEAEKNIAELRDKEAEGNFKIAVFYEKQKAYTAAKFYYETVARDYPDSKMAKDAVLKAEEMDRLAQGKKRVDKKALKEERLKIKAERLDAKKKKIEEKKRIKLEKKEKIKEAKQNKSKTKEQRLADKKANREEKRRAKLEKVAKKIEVEEGIKEQESEEKEATQEVRSEEQGAVKEEIQLKAEGQALTEKQLRLEKKKKFREQRLAEKKKAKEDKLAEKRARIEEKKKAKLEAKAKKLENKKQKPRQLSKEERIKQKKEERLKKKEEKRIEALKKKELREARIRDAKQEKESRRAKKKAEKEKRIQKKKEAKEEKRKAKVKAEAKGEEVISTEQQTQPETDTYTDITQEGKAASEAWSNVQTRTK